MARTSRPTLTQCVLWRPPHQAAPSDLLASLRRRAVAVTECADPFTALAHICRIDREGRDPVVLLLVSPADLPEAAEVLDAASRYAPHAARWWYDEDESPRLKQVAPEDIVAWTPRRPAPAAAPAPPVPPSIAGAFTAVEPASPARRHGKGGGALNNGGPALRLTGETHRSGAAVGSNGEPGLHAGRNGASGGGSGGSRVLPETGEDGPAPSPSTLLTNEELAMLLADDTPVQQPPPMRRTGAADGGGSGGSGGGGGSGGVH